MINFCPHNLREGFHALYALIRFRGDGKAAELAEQSLETIRRFWHPQTGWRTDRLAEQGICFQPCQSFVHGEARMLGPLVKLYRTTGSPAALELALILGDRLLDTCFPEDGRFLPERFGTTHVHSITCVLSSLAQLAELLQDQACMERVHRFYRLGLWALRDEIGWSPESTEQHDSDHGEMNNSGDILETALILGRWGHPAAFQDAERMLRAHLLPAQLRDVSFIQDPPRPGGRDELYQVADRHLGAYGFPAPYGHESIGKGRGGVSFNLDIVGGAVASLCEAYRDAVRTLSTGTWIDLFFDRETEAARVDSPYPHGDLVVTVRKPGPLFVRIPDWMDPSSFRPQTEPDSRVWRNAYLFVPHPPVGEAIHLPFPRPERDIVLAPHLHIHPIRVRLRGDEVVAMENFGADLTFFPALS